MKSLRQNVVDKHYITRLFIYQTVNCYVWYHNFLLTTMH